MQQADITERTTGKRETVLPKEGSDALIESAIWQLEVCNACRYCEGYCAVFPALERRQRPKPSDVYYLANLCHDCRPCYYVCMFAPPHEFAVNLPQAFAEVRRRTYSRYALPGLLSGLVGNNLLLAVVVAVLAVVFWVAAVALTGDIARLFAAPAEPGSFYTVIPYVIMFLPPLLMALYGVVALAGGTLKFWRETHGSLGDLLDLRAFVEAGADALSLRHMQGGEDDGCYYPGDSPSKMRWILHLGLLWGFISAFAASAIAFIYQDFLHWMPPYPILSAPVILGSLGGIAMIVGATGLVYLKWRSNPAPADRPHIAMDYVFLTVVDIVAITGMLLLALRETPAMGSLLVVHLAAISTLFVSAPYGKFAHLVYRYAALVQNRIESRESH